MTGFTLLPGVTVHIKFSNANSADDPKLKFNGEADENAKAIMQYGTTPVDKTSETDGWYAGAVVSFTYDGTNWIRDQGFNTNTKVTQTRVTDNQELSVLLKNTNNTTDETNGVKYNNLVTINPNSGMLKAITFSGSGAALTDLTPTNLTGVVSTTAKKFLKDTGAWVQVDWGDLTNKPTTLSGYGITDADISSGTITLGSNTITPVTSVNGYSGPSVVITAADLGLTSALKYVGIESSLPTATDVNTYSTYNNGDVITVNYKEYVYIKGVNANTSSWVELGDEGSYKLKQTAFTNSTGSADENNTSTTFIYSFSQTADGVIQNIKNRKLPTASTSVAGIIKIGTDADDAMAGNTTITNVSYTNTTDSDNEYPVLFKNSTGTTATAAGVRFISATNKSVTINGNTGALTALGGFIGNLTGNVTGNLAGNASTATSWTEAQTVYVNLEYSGTNSTLNGGQDTEQVLKVNGILPIGNGGTGTSTAPNQYGVIYAATTSTYASTAAGDTGNVFIAQTNGAPIWYTGLSLESTTSNNVTSYSADFFGTVSIRGAATLTGNVGIGTDPDNSYKLTINGSTQIVSGSNVAAHLDNSTITIDSTTYQTVNFFPENTDTGSLGLGGGSPKRWSTLYLGTADTYGDAYTPIYWNAGVPAATSPVQYVEWEIASGKKGVQLKDEAFTTSSYVLQLVITSGESYLKGPLTWEFTNPGANDNGKGSFIIESTVAIASGTNVAVAGYALVARGTTLNIVTTDKFDIT